MGFRTLCCILLLTQGLRALAADPNCPAYPASQRTALLQSEARLRVFRSFSAARVHKGSSASKYALTSDDNIVDQYIFGKMQADGVEPAAASSDSEWVR